MHGHCRTAARYISQEAEEEYLAQQNAIKSDRPSTSYLAVPPGAGFRVELLPETAAGGYDVMLQMRLPQLPIPGKVGWVELGWVGGWWVSEWVSE